MRAIALRELGKRLTNNEGDQKIVHVLALVTKSTTQNSNFKIQKRYSAISFCHHFEDVFVSVCSVGAPASVAFQIVSSTCSHSQLFEFCRST